MFSIRFFTEYQKKGGFQEFVDRYTSKCISCLEVSKQEKEHVHAVIFTDYSKSTIRKNFRKIVLDSKNSGNKAYSLKETKNLDKALSYTCKDGKKYVLKGYPENDIKKYQEKSKEYIKKLKKPNLKGVPYFMQLFERLKSNKKLREYIIKFIDIEFTDSYDKKHAFNDALRSIEIIILKCYIKDCKAMPNKYQLKSVVRSVLAQLLKYYGYLTNMIAMVMYNTINEYSVWEMKNVKPTHKEILKYVEQESNDIIKNY